MFDVESISQIAPSYAFFGNTKGTALNVNVSRKVKRIVFSNELKGKSFLNVADIRVLSSDFNDLDSVRYSVSYSSIRGEASRLGIFRGEGFHSNREVNPWLELTFEEPMKIDSVKVLNRGDLHAKRNQFINISVEDEFGGKDLLYSPQSPESMGRFYYLMEVEFGSDILKRYMSSPSKEVFRNKVLLPTLVSKVREREIAKESCLFILQFLSLWNEKGKEYSYENHDSELYILAYLVSLFLGAGIGFPLKPYSRLLDTRHNIEIFSEYLNEFREKNGFSQVMLTKHGLAKKGKLLEDVDCSLSCIRKIFDDIKSMGYQPMLAYGTLLGAYRDEAFMFHDDDIDIIVKFSSNSKSAVEEEMNRFSECLIQKGYLVGALNKNLNRHFRHKALGVTIDVFPCWLEGDRCFLHMEKMNIRDIDSEIFNGISYVNLHGMSLPAPNKVTDFLSERYGESWHIPDKYHEWPWELKNI